MSNGSLLGEEARRDVRLYYDFDKSELGKGSFGTVVMACVRGTDVRRAVKVIEKARVSNAERFRLEIEIMMRLDHPNVLRLYDYFEDAKNVYLVLELCTGGELFDRIVKKKFYNEEEARPIFRQIMLSILYCHQNGVCHRDLKPENFMMVFKEGDALKLIDFGLSRTFVSETAPLTPAARVAADSPAASPKGSPARGRRQTKAVLQTKAGTPFYIAPEVLTGNYNEKCDVWSAGVILYILLCGSPPFYGESNHQIIEAAKRGKLDFSAVEWKGKSRETIELIQKMVTHHETRLFADEVLKQPFLAGVALSVEQRRVRQIAAHLRAFAALPTAKKLLTYFVARGLYEEQLLKMHDYFHYFDKTSIGSIGLEDFCATLSAVEEGVGAAELFASLDVFEQRTLPYSLFVAAAFPRAQFVAEARLRPFFILADFDRDGLLGQDDLECFLRVQFRHRPNVPAALRSPALFAELGIIGRDFKGFVRALAD